MTLLDLIPGLKKFASTGGGEYGAGCPWCGGWDWFRVWPNEGPTGRYWCRGCGKSGDGLQLIRELKGLSFPEALKAWGLPSNSRHRIPSGQQSARATWEPREAKAPGTTWTEKAASFLAGCQGHLAGPSGADCREWLKGRGLKIETIERTGLGWNPVEQFHTRESWGLPPEMKEDGKPRRVWLPAGLVIPCFTGGRVIRLRVRRPDPGEGPRYVIITGSSSSPLILVTGGAWVIVESELDALLLAQEAGHLAGVIALGNAQTRPDIETDRTLKEADLILIALDSDEAGAREAWGFWKRTYPNARRWPCPIGKDSTEAMQAGLDLRAWVIAGLPDKLEPETPTEPTQSAATHHQEGARATKPENEYPIKGGYRKAFLKPFPVDWKPRFNEETLERLAIMTTDGGLTDLEALKVIGQ